MTSNDNSHRTHSLAMQSEVFVNHCPSVEVLASYLSDEAADDDVAPLLRHIETCAICRELMRDISGDLGLGVPLKDYAKECQPASSFSQHEHAVGENTSPVRLPRPFPTLTVFDREDNSGCCTPGDTETDSCIETVCGETDCCDETGSSNVTTECCDAADIKAKCCNKNRYEEIALHAKGGLGEVVRVQDLEMEREVALKRIQPHRADDRNSRLRFIREAIITGKLEHPGIVPVYGRGNDVFGRPYYAMRFVDGTSLKNRITEFHDEYGSTTWRFGEARIRLQSLLRRLIAVCNTIEYAHSQGVIHRDLKPDNIIVGRFGETIVLDWGLAKHTLSSGADVRLPSDESGFCEAKNDEDLIPTLFGEAIGTIGYMSPEQSNGRLDEVGPASDVYSLGAILYRILTGQNSQESSHDRREVLDAIKSGDFLRPRNVKLQIPPPLEAICLKAMATEPSHRYASPSDMARELERFIASERVHAHQESATEQMVRFGKRHRIWLAIGLTAVASALAVRIAMTSWNLESGRRLQTQQFSQAMEDLQSSQEQLDRERAVFMEQKNAFEASTVR